MEASAAAAAGAGFILVRHIDAKVDIAEPSRTILFSQDPSSLDLIAVEKFAVVATGVSAVGALEANSNADRFGATFEVSRFLAVAASLQPDQTTTFNDSDVDRGSREFLAFGDMPIAVPDGVVAKARVKISRYHSDVASALQIYREGAVSVGQSASWASTIFSYDNRSKVEPPSPCVDLTGIPRLLVSGPYIHLPAGEWRAVATFSVDSRAARHRYRFEWGGLEAFTSFETSPRQPGLYTIDMRHEWQRVAFAELRVVLLEGSLGGDLTFLGVEVTRVG